MNWNWRRIWRIGVLAFVGVQIVRVTVFKQEVGEDTAPDAPDPGQQIVLTLDAAAGTEIPFVMQRLNVYLTEDDSYPETFAFEGEGIRLVGKLPLNLRVDYGEHWDVLVGRPISISRSDDALEAGSEIHLPDSAPCPVTGGAFTIHEVGEGGNAKTPLAGDLWLRCATPDGERILRGTFQVKGTTWG